MHIHDSDPKDTPPHTKSKNKNKKKRSHLALERVLIADLPQAQVEREYH
jgi:hypothetical protein